MDGDRERWNAKWRERIAEREPPDPFLLEHADLLPPRGKALDVAGGGGRNAIWLARRGLDVTLLDVSDVALERAERWAISAGVARRMRFLRLDLDHDELSLAPLFDLVLVFNYLNRERRDDLAALVQPDGLLVALQPTVHNLERHASPGKPYLVDPGELDAWARATGLAILVSHERWNTDGRHVAAVIARRPPLDTNRPRHDDSGPTGGPYR